MNRTPHSSDYGVSPAMKHIVYKTTNLVNGKYYIGKHSCNCSPKCNYLGSGNAITRAIKKYGRENFERNIIAEFDNEKEALKYESDLVTEKEVCKKNCYNLRIGGGGGDTIIANNFKKPCAIDHIDFESLAAAARHFNTSVTTIHRWIDHNESKSQSIKSKQEKIPVFIDDIYFESISEASRHFGVAPCKIRKWQDQGGNSCFDSYGINCTIEGKEYSSIIDAAKDFGVPRSQIYFYIENGSFPESSCIPVTIDSIYFESIKSASRHFNVNGQTIDRWVKEGGKSREVRRRPKITVEYEGVTYESIAHLARRLGVSHPKAKRMASGGPLELNSGTGCFYKGREFKSLTEAEKHFPESRKTIKRRIDKGIDGYYL